MAILSELDKSSTEESGRLVVANISDVPEDESRKSSSAERDERTDEHPPKLLAPVNVYKRKQKENKDDDEEDSEDEEKRKKSKSVSKNLRTKSEPDSKRRR